MDSLRDKAQLEALRLAELYGNICLEWATGLGKSKASLDIAEKIGGKWYIICAETKHINNWKAEIKKYGYELDVEIFCYASLHKFVNTRANLILDEYQFGLNDICYFVIILALLSDIYRKQYI